MSRPPAAKARGGPLRLLDDVGVRPDVAQALQAARTATDHWRLGEAEPAKVHADLSYRLATAGGDSGALARAHIVLALAHSLQGQPDDVIEHYQRASAHAAGVGDRLLMARIDANLSHHLLADARFVEAVEAAAAAATAAVRLDEPRLEVVALENQADALVRLGGLDEAAGLYRRALALADRLGTARTAGALAGLAQVHARRGAREQELAVLRAAHRLVAGHPEADREVRVIVLGGLARALAGVDPERAHGLAQEALTAARGSGVLPALLASVSTALALGEQEAARQAAERAVEHASHRRERAWLAQALEVRAETAPGLQARAALREAHGIWAEAGAAHDADRVLVRLAAVSADVPRDRVAGRVAALRATAAGLTVPTRDPDVVISTFGRFEVRVAGALVPASAWQSRRARDLLRLLVARRGRAIARLQLCEELWPDEDPTATGHRLSVLLSILRGVIGAEALAAEREGVALDTSRVRVDVEEFLADVKGAVDLARSGSPQDARILLTAALHRHTDEPFADTPYDDVTLDLREEVRAAHLQALRLVARLCRVDGEHDEAADHLRRLLATDPYDEDAHLALVAVLTEAGRHGQARSAAERHRRAMAELGLPAQG